MPTLTQTPPPAPRKREPVDVSTLSKTLQNAINDQAAHEAFAEFRSDLDKLMDDEYTLWQLHCAFDLVKNPNNWKDPINGVIDRTDVDIVAEAARFFAGSPCDITEELDDNQVRMEGPGYYVCIGS